ncbi:MAG: glycosyltransferase family 4 protein, partial [Candidatus Binatia bacterium]
MIDRQLKIAFIGGRGVGGTYSGIETYYEEVGSRLAQRGHEVTAYCRTYFTPATDWHRGIRVRRLPALRSKHLETLSHSVLCTIDSLRRRFDIIQYHAIGSAPLSLLPRLMGRTTVLSVRGLDWQRAKWGRGARAFLKFGEWASAHCPVATVVVSRTLQQHYLNAHGRAPYFIPNAVVPAAPRPAHRIARYGLEKDGFLLFAGRLSPEKGVHTLLEAMRPLRRNVKLVLAGGSSYSDGYIETLHHAAWDGVVFPGNVDRETMEELYSNCYAYVLPSVMEGLSVGLLEALSYGACILTTAIPENLEVVGSAGLSFPPRDVTALRTLLREVLDNADLVREYRRRATAHAGAQPGWDEVVRETENLY